MKWNESQASLARYADLAKRLWGDWEILWEDCDISYSGHADFIAMKEGKYSAYRWSYGSCSGCDRREGEDLSDEQIVDEMRKEARWFNDREGILAWLKDLASKPINDDYGMDGLTWDGLEKIEQRIKAVEGN